MTIGENDNYEVERLITNDQIKLRTVDAEEYSVEAEQSRHARHYFISSFRQKSISSAKKIFYLVILIIVCFCLLIIFTRKSNNHAGGPTFDVVTKMNQNKNQDDISNLRLEDIRHWCLNGGDEVCNCLNPLEPQERNDTEKWIHAHEMNMERISSWSSSSEKKTLDVVFLGDSITEGWQGTSIGYIREDKAKIKPVFESLFTVKGGGKFEGVALGIAGDKSPNLLWRIMHGELPSNLHSRVFWLLIGTNDLLHDRKANIHCSEEVALLGIVRVIEELERLLRRPDSVIVVNGLLPRTDDIHTGQLQVYNNSTAFTSFSPKRTIWEAVVYINKKLQTYCEGRSGLLYFDATSLFVRENKTLGKYIPRELMEDFLHPTVLGYQIWGEKIVEKLQSIIN